MKSYWLIHCDVGHIQNVIKKFERFANVKTVDFKSGRVSLCGVEVDIGDFFLEHAAILNWDQLVMELLSKAAIISPWWSLTVTSEHLRAEYDPKKSRLHPKISGLQSLTWEILKNQTYTRMRW